MPSHDYRVIPAPTRGKKAPGLKTAEARFARAIETCINDMAADGWDYMRADILPSAERQGLTGTQTVYRTLLVFRRPREDAEARGAQADAPEISATHQRADDTSDPPLGADRAHWADEGGLAPEPRLQTPEDLRDQAGASLQDETKDEDDHTSTDEERR